MENREEQFNSEESALDRQLALLIVECIRNNEKLPSEQEMMDRFQVSRFMLRKALQTFEINGIITPVQGSGRYAQFPDLGIQIRNVWSIFIEANPSFLLDLLEIRKILEIHSLPLAMKQFRTEDLFVLRAQVEGMRKNLAAGLPFFQYDRAFHKTLFLSTGNPVLSQLLSAFWDLYETSKIAENAETPNSEDVINLHYNIMEAFARQDLDRATALLEENFKDMRNKITLAIIANKL